ncbi:MAG: hypothetical protein COS11_00105, partial [bacterium (Candidatus Ratteibacteria) CG01_land_8_20_14_3_00_40_19]
RNRRGADRNGVEAPSPSRPAQGEKWVGTSSPPHPEGIPLGHLGGRAKQCSLFVALAPLSRHFLSIRPEGLADLPR